MSSCPVCGAPVPQLADYCSQCGEATSDIDRGSALAGRTGTNAIIGGAVAFLLGVTIAAVLGPLYVIGIGGGAGLAGYLHDSGQWRGGLVGGIAGFLATVPIALFAFAGTVLSVLWTLFHIHGYGVPGIDGALGVLSITVLGLLLFSVFVNVIFGAIGGIVGAMLRSGSE